MMERIKPDSENGVPLFAWVPERLGPEGRYQWVSALSTGGQGYAELYRDTWSNGLVVVKGFWWNTRELDPGAAAVRRSAREESFHASVDIQLQLSHLTQSVPSVVELVSEISPTRRKLGKLVPDGAGAPDINHESFLVMQFVGDADGTSQSLRSLVEKEGPLSSAEAVSLADQVAAGLEAMHTPRQRRSSERSGSGSEGPRYYWAHSDLKPDNILVSGSPRRFTLIDHSAAKQVHAVRDQDDLPRPDYATDAFAPPDLDEPLTNRFDVYSLAATLVYALTGEPPGSGDEPLKTARDLAALSVHPTLVRLIASCLDANPSFRVTAPAFRRDLAAVNAFATFEVLSR